MDGEIVKAAIALIQQIGFPIFVAGWFMLRLEKRIEVLTDAIEKLGEKIK